jgi:putative heme transporter
MAGISGRGHSSDRVVPDVADEIEPGPTPSARDVGVDPGRTLVVVDWISFAHLAVALLALLALLGITQSAARSLTLIVIATVLALALDGPVRVLKNRCLPRGAAVGVVCVAVLVAVGAVAVLLGPPAAREAAAFADELPATLEEFYDFPLVGDRLQEAEVAARAEQWIDDLPGNVTVDSVAEAMDRVIAGIANVVLVLLLTFAILLDGELLVRRVRSLIPAHLRHHADRGGRLAYNTLGRYFAGSLLLALFSGTYTLTVGLILGVPLVLLAALWVAITDLIPQIGGFLGGSVFVTLALTQGAVTGALALVLFVVYMSSENYLLHPTIVGSSVNLSPPATMLAAIIGGTAAGVPGALVATPFVGSVKAVYMAARHGSEPDDDPAGERAEDNGSS